MTDVFCVSLALLFSVLLFSGSLKVKIKTHHQCKLIIWEVLHCLCVVAAVEDW